MKVAKIFAVLFAVAGIVLMLGSCVICFASLNRPVEVLEYPEDVGICFDQFAEAVNAGDYAALEQLLYGQPKLGADQAPEDIHVAMVWDAFRETIQFSYTGKAFLQDSDFVREAAISALDITALTSKLEAQVRSVLQETIVAAEDPAALYDAAGNFRTEVVEKALQQSLEQLLSQNASFVTRDVTIKLVRRDGHWWAVPDQTFMQTISAA